MGGYSATETVETEGCIGIVRAQAIRQWRYNVGLQTSYHWWVYTPPYGDDQYSYGSDVVEVEAPNKRKALVLGIRKLRLERSRWVQDQQSDRRSPFNGLNATREN